MTVETQALSITTGQAGACIGVSGRMVQKYIVQGILPAHVIQKPFRPTYRINIDALRAFAAERGLPFDEVKLKEAREKPEKRFKDRPVEAIFVS